MIRVAIDGPSGAGKSTISRYIAKELGLVYIDTGAMFRAIGLYMLRKGVVIKQEAQKVIHLLPEVEVELIPGEEGTKVLLCAEDVTTEIRTPDASMAASDVSAIPEVREKVLILERKMSEKVSCIMDGRDIGTTVLPYAELKIFLTATPEARAYRRYLELQESGNTDSYETVLADMKRRDENDSTRAASPLKKAEDAIVFDSTELSLEETKKQVCAMVKEKMDAVSNS